MIRAIDLSLALACVAVPASAQTKKTKADVDAAQKKMLEAATKAKTTGCGKTIPGHVYHKERLQVYSNCIAVTGKFVDATAGKRTDGVRKEGDGDTHGCRVGTFPDMGSARDDCGRS